MKSSGSAWAMTPLADRRRRHRVYKATLDVGSATDRCSSAPRSYVRSSDRPRPATARGRGNSSQCRPSSSRPPDLGRCPPHCLKKNATSSRVAAIAEIADPLRVDRAVARAGLAAGDEPVDSVEVKTVKRSEKRLGGDEPHCRGHRAQGVGSMHESAILDRDPHPDVRAASRSRQRARPGGRGVWSEPGRCANARRASSSKTSLDEVERDVLVEEVATSS